MYEDKTTENLLTNMLAEVDDSYQKSVGFPIYDLLKAVAMTLNEYYHLMNDVANSLDVDHLTGSKLERFIYQRKGLKRKEATFASGLLEVIGNGTVMAGDLFESAGGIQFQATKSTVITGSSIIPVAATISGPAGEVGANTVNMIPKTIQGITACTNPEAITGGYHAETDDSLRQRYYEALQKPATSGNIYHYMLWAKEVAGVGDAKVFPLWNGDNTVLVIIIDDEKQPADSELINRVQNYIDPNISGTGSGQAPIGAYCTVKSADRKEISVSVKLKLIEGYGLSIVLETIKSNIVEYLKETAFKQDYISLGKISAVIIGSEGVDDYSDLRLNNQSGNIKVGEKEVAVLKEVTAIEC